MPKFSSLFSSSKGNSTYLASSKTRILIDAGVSCKRLCEALKQREVEPDTIDAVLITHEHSDHIKGVRVFCSKYNIPIYATKGTLSALKRNDTINGKYPSNEVIPGIPFELGDLVITATGTPHDAAQSCMYKVEFPDERKAAVATDMGVLLPDVHDELCGCDLVLLESNHDVSMLMTGPYPFDLKKRVRSNYGHMSNDDCAKEAISLIESGTTRLFLGHLSEQNNLPDLAYETTVSEMKMQGMTVGTDCIVEVCKPTGDAKIVRF